MAKRKNHNQTPASFAKPFRFSAKRFLKAPVKSSSLKFALLVLFLLISGSAAEAQVRLDFNNYALESGTDLLQGARYRFTNVAPGTDCIVTLTTITAGTTLIAPFDNNASNPFRLQPVIRTTAANTTGYVRFDFQLVKSGTTTARAVPSVKVAAQDIDGTTSSNREFVELVGMQSTNVSNPTTLITKTAILAGGVAYAQGTPGTDQAGIGTGNQYEFYGTLADSATSFTMIAGNLVGTANCTANDNTCNRLNSYAFDPVSANVTLPAPDVSITKTGPATVTQNNTVTYTLIARNNGPTTAHGSTVTDTLPASLTGVSISCVAASGAVCPSTAGLTTLSNEFIPTFPSGGQVTFTITGTASSVGTLTNTATIAPPNGSTDPTPANNTSATVSTIVNAPTYSITGNVFEDLNYSGGSGRSLLSSGGTGRGGARVELYNSVGAFVSSTTTATAGTIGQYQFTNLAAGSYTVRVVNDSVSSSRVGYVPTLIGVQTFRTNNGAGDTNRVGGEDPTKAGSAANTTNATLATLTTATTTPQSIGAVTLTNANTTGVDFGFNFDTVVNINDSGQGSLRQFITNANALSGADSSIFMISDGAAHNGLRSGLTNQLTGGVAVITLAILLPAVADASTTIDGTTQTANVGNTNSGSLGVGGTVGVGSLSLSTVARPEVLITDGATNLQIGLDLQGASETVRGVAIYGFGASPNSNADANIRLGASASSALIEQNILGATATAFADPGSATRSTGDNIRSVGAGSGILRNNLIGFSAGKGFGVENGSTGWTIENNEIRGNGIGNSYLDGIDLESAGTTGNTVRGNLVVANEGVGVDSYQSNGSNTIVNNTITGNGVGTSGAVETAGVRLYGANNSVDRNIINANYGAGVMATANASASTITRNSIYANGTVLNKSGGAASAQIGIDLQSSADAETTGTSPYVTVNDSGDGDAGANGLLNFPVLETARVVGGNLVLTGYARPGATVEFFIAAPDPSGFGEGQTYLFTFTEGAVEDTDATTGTYTSPFGGKTVGTDTTNRFQFSIALPGSVSVGTVLTATATLSAATSEFSNTIAVGNAPPAIGLVKSFTPSGAAQPGAEITYSIAFSNTGGQSATGFILIDPNPANNTLRLNTNTDFKIGSVVNALGTTGLTATVAYSNDNGATFAYTPVSAGGGAPAGFDRSVTHIRWTFANALSQTAPNNAGSVSFVVRIR